MRRGVLVVCLSCIAHALVALALLRTHMAPTAAQPPAVVTVELVDVVAEQPAIPARTGGGTRGSYDVRARRTEPRREPQSAARFALGPVHIDRDGRDGGSDGGDGTGRGGGHGDGDGIGLGIGDLPPVTPIPAPPPAPAPPVVSRARPARLIYPSRQTAIEEDALFVARLVVDHEGFVVGARLVRGFGGHRDEEAASAVWRFRYDPARDDLGRPVRSTVEQHFHVAQ